MSAELLYPCGSCCILAFMIQLRSDEIQLHALGLTPAACRCYVVLLDNFPRPLRTARLKEQAAVPVSTLYRSLRELVIKGFAERSPRIVTADRYRAIPLSYALDNYALYQRKLVQPLLQRVHAAALLADHHKNT